jgi:hypothetical protein
MNRRLLLVIVVTIMLSGPARGATTRLLGCADPDVMAKALKSISESDWEDISESRLQSVWPMEVRGSDCDTGTCQTLLREDLKINGECECCELFHFTVDRDGKGKAINGHLRSIVIHYSASSRNEALDTGKMLARAMGLAASDAATVGRKSQQKFFWYIGQGKRQDVGMLEVQVTHRRRVWKVYFHVSHQAALAGGPAFGFEFPGGRSLVGFEGSGS